MSQRIEAEYQQLVEQRRAQEASYRRNFGGDLEIANHLRNGSAPDNRVFQAYQNSPTLLRQNDYENQAPHMRYQTTNIDSEPFWMRGNPQPKTGVRGSKEWYNSQNLNPITNRVKSLPNLAQPLPSTGYYFDQALPGVPQAMPAQFQPTRYIGYMLDRPEPYGASGTPMLPGTIASNLRPNYNEFEYRQALEKQVREKHLLEQRRKIEESQKSRRMAEEVYDPWGKGGGGAPMRDQDGNVIADRGILQRAWRGVDVSKLTLSRSPSFDSATYYSRRAANLAYAANLTAQPAYHHHGISLQIDAPSTSAQNEIDRTAYNRIVEPPNLLLSQSIPNLNNANNNQFAPLDRLSLQLRQPQTGYEAALQARPSGNEQPMAYNSMDSNGYQMVPNPAALMNGANNFKAQPFAPFMQQEWNGHNPTGYEHSHHTNFYDNKLSNTYHQHQHHHAGQNKEKDDYREFLQMQIEEKRRREQHEKLKERMEDERERIRLLEDQRRLKAEEDAEKDRQKQILRNLEKRREILIQKENFNNSTASNHNVMQQHQKLDDDANGDDSLEWWEKHPKPNDPRADSVPIGADRRTRRRAELDQQRRASIGVPDLSRPGGQRADSAGSSSRRKKTLPILPITLYPVIPPDTNTPYNYM